MIRHIVCLTTFRTDAAARGASARRSRAELESLLGRIPQLWYLEMGPDLGEIAGRWDAVLVTDFESSADRAMYGPMRRTSRCWAGSARW